MPLFSEVGEQELQRLVAIFRPVGFEDGDRLVRQGQLADGAYLLTSGCAEVITALPGGGAASVARLLPGSMIGEMALLERAVRSATVVARGRVGGYYIERDTFRVLLARRERAAFTMRRRVTRTLCERLRNLNGRIVATEPGAPAVHSTAKSTSLGGIRRGACAFDYRAFLPILPAFAGFGGEEIEQFARRAEVVELARGQDLFRQGDPGAAAYVVVRGAIELSHATSRQRQRIGILGPGRLCGILALLENAEHSLSATARENTVALEISKATFDALLDADDLASARFHDAIDRELLQALARTNNHLTRLISQARIQGGRRRASAADRLQCALAITEFSPSADSQSR